MGFLDKAKDTVTKATETAKDKYDDLRDRRRASDLLEDIGRVVYRQHTDRANEFDENDIVRLVGELQTLEAEGVDVLGEQTP
jgi:hypothetical protein